LLIKFSGGLGYERSNKIVTVLCHVINLNPSCSFDVTKPDFYLNILGYIEFWILLDELDISLSSISTSG